MTDSTTFPSTYPATGVGIATRGMTLEEPLLFESSRPGAVGYSLPKSDVPECDPANVLPSEFLREDIANFPELSEPEVVRHFTRMSTWNAAVDLGLYPLGSCTMKYNPKVNERVARLSGFANTHPLQPQELSQGLLGSMMDLSEYLAEIAGFDHVTLQPAAGAQGELAGVMMIRAYHEARGETRTKILIPDTAHGTNPASAALNGYETISIPTGDDGILHPEAVEPLMGPDVAGLMITNPNTLGLFEENLVEIAEIIHNQGGLIYGDGANLNALMGIARPGDLGIDVMHFNLHKTFTTPHGGGGPGSGPVGIKAHLEPFLPKPVLRIHEDGAAFLDYDRPQSIGRLHGNLGNVGMMTRALTYIRFMGPDGLKRSTEMAVLNANYVAARLKHRFVLATGDRPVMHECVFSDEHLEGTDVTTMDVAKRLIDYGYHPPTTYFPLIVHGALMIEPTESESRESLDRFIAALLAIDDEARRDPDLLHKAPHNTRLTRLDETRAARKPILRWSPENGA